MTGGTLSGACQERSTTGYRHLPSWPVSWEKDTWNNAPGCSCIWRKSGTHIGRMVEWRGVDMMRNSGNTCPPVRRWHKMAKVDIESAFRLLPVHPQSHRFLGCFVDGQYFVDLCLPMECSFSCSYFEAFSTFLLWVAHTESGCQGITHYLNDFLFVGPAGLATCDFILRTFSRICQDFGVKLAENKTEEPTTDLTFLGIWINSDKMECSLPMEKVFDLSAELAALEGARRVSLRWMQSILGKLNFAGSIVPIGRIFSRRMSLATAGISQPHHFIKVSGAMREDALVWTAFLRNFNGSTLIQPSRVTNGQLDLYAGSSAVGMGAYFGGAWCAESWVKGRLTEDPTVLVHLWGRGFRNRQVLFQSGSPKKTSRIRRHRRR
ncbi:uncharacterized protein O3C94_008463 [Discoglossus pictus]